MSVIDPIVAAGLKPPMQTRSKRPAQAVAAPVPPSRFWVDKKNRTIIEAWLKMTRQPRPNLLIVGPSGAGKTELLIRLGRQLDIPVYKIDCASMTTSEKWLGRRELRANDKGQVETTYVMSEHLRWLEAVDTPPGIILYDEITRLSPPLLNVLIPILDGSRSVWVPDLDRQVHVHPDTLFAATANIGAQFSGTYSLDVALADRFGIVVECYFPPARDEVLILVERSGISNDQAEKLVSFAKEARTKHVKGDISSPVSTRSLIHAALLISEGVPPIEAIRASVINRYPADTDERSILGLIAEGMFAS